ncbi:MAG: penicillin-binding protein 2 [Candidatus Nanopelagicales bacterium]|nr:penicillin-binding protein 2 [Candidatus Nanopelagicales bacterium]
MLTDPLIASFKSLSKPFRLTDGRGRMRVTLLVALVVFSLYAVRLVDLQAIQADSLAAKAEGIRTVRIKLPAMRGSITDTKGVALVQSVPARDITADPVEVKNPALYAEKLSPVLGIPAEKIEKSLQRRTLPDGRDSRFAYVARGVRLEVWKQIRELDLVGVFSEETSVRDYPAGSLAANVLGFVGENPEGTAQVGMAGLERMFDSQLAGQDGSKRYEASSSGGEIPTGSRVENDPVPGMSIRTTIDRDLQWAAQNAMATRVKEVEADSGLMVVIEPSTGKIRAMVDVPTAIPNDPKRNPSHLRNRVVEDAFEPGSTAKVMTMAAVLEEGKADPGTVITVPNRLERGGTQFKDDVDHPTYRMTLTGILSWSSNLGTLQAAEKIGADKLVEYHRKFGIAQPTGLGFSGENKGTEPTPGSSNWSSTSFPTLAFGQGFTWNALQAASVFATIANGGVRVTPSLIESYTSPEGDTKYADPPTSTRVISEQTARTLTGMMEQVVGDGGTARDLAIPGYLVAGKTGTAYRYTEKGRDGYTASFIGFAPSKNPDIVIATIMQNPRKEVFGSTAAGPAFVKAMVAALQQRRVAPTGDKLPKMTLFAKDSAKGGPWNY